MNPAKWWNENWGQIRRLKNSQRTRINRLMRKKGIVAAEKLLWNEILKLEDLSVDRGIKKMVYVGGERELLTVATGQVEITRDGRHYITVNKDGTPS